ncbi:MAG: CDP-alcohol phosphatidyltransferase family protein [Rhodocyclales bacterium]|nr:CDP-alcohol phosphatidyltransferase family protein [Rhodocyclales bacterium]
MNSLYELKPRFQAMLRPLVRRCATIGISANGVTLTAMLVSVALGAWLVVTGENRRWFLLLPLWMLLRMAFNAIDGMLAREFGQQSPLGAYLNELSDVVSDAALYLPFVLVAPFGWVSIGAVVFLSILSEMAGALGPMIGVERRYDGPMGKSDRALVFGSMGLWVALTVDLPEWAFWVMPVMAAAIVLNVFNRVRGGIASHRAQIS